MSDPFIGRQFGDYVVQDLLGRGGMARVYKGYDARLQRFAAVKIINSELVASADQQEYTERFQREARAIARLNHPNIVGVYQFGEYDQGYYMAMVFIEGRDLRQILRDYNARSERMPLEDVVNIVRGIAYALDYAHHRGVIHRDVKPSNIMLNADNQPVLTDFGLALNATEGTMGDTFGSAHYIAPEQAVSSAKAVPQSDLYSLGVCTYEMLTGKVPFDDPSAMSVALKHLNDPPPSLMDQVPGLDPEIEAVVMKALEKDPGERYATGAQMAQAFMRAVAASTWAEPPPEPYMMPISSLSSIPASLTQDSSPSRPSALKQDRDTLTIPEKKLEVPPAPSRPVWLYAIGAVILGMIAIVILAQSRQPAVTQTPTSGPTQVALASEAATPPATASPTEAATVSAIAAASATVPAATSASTASDSTSTVTTPSAVAVVPTKRRIPNSTPETPEPTVETPTNTVIPPSATTQSPTPEAPSETPTNTVAPTTSVPASQTESPTRIPSNTPAPTDTATPVYTPTEPATPLPTEAATAAASATVAATENVAPTGELLIEWDDQQFVLVNTGSRWLDLSNLQFVQTHRFGERRFEAVRWDMDSARYKPNGFPPGWCFQINRGDVGRVTPFKECIRLSSYVILMDNSRWFWLAANSTAVDFDVFLGDKKLTTCSLTSGKCAFSLPDSR